MQVEGFDWTWKWEGLTFKEEKGCVENLRAPKS